MNHEHEPKFWEYMKPFDGYFDDDGRIHPEMPGTVVEAVGSLDDFEAQPVVSSVAEKDMERGKY